MAKLLVVDDEIDIIEVTKRYFTRRGVETFTASEGVEAFRLLQENNPDLILLDYNLPGMSGKEILQKIRGELKLNTKIIIVTGFETEKIMEETKDLGVNDYIHKPLDLAKLEKMVFALLNGPQ